MKKPNDTTPTQTTVPILDRDPVLAGLLIANAIWQAVNGPHLPKDGGR